MVSHKNYNLIVNEGFVKKLTSKFITCFIDGFTSKMKFHSTAYLLNESEHTYWILDLEDEVRLIWVIWTSGLQGQFDFLKLGGAGKEHGLHLGSEGGVPRTGPNLGQM